MMASNRGSEKGVRGMEQTTHSMRVVPRFESKRGVADAIKTRHRFWTAVIAFLNLDRRPLEGGLSCFEFLQMRR
jgi:hypothetical protein